MKAAVRALFERYEAVFNRALAGDFDAEEARSLYASHFVDASPAGVITGAIDADFTAAMEKGYEAYRRIGTQAMRLRGVRVTLIDGLHGLAHVAWTAVYRREDLPETEIDFEVHYLVQLRDGEPRVFGWIAGDEEALLKARGVI